MFHIYKKEFVCDKCLELSFMGIVGYSEEHINICDICLVNEIEDAETTKTAEVEFDVKYIQFTNKDRL